MNIKIDFNTVKFTLTSEDKKILKNKVISGQLNSDIENPFIYIKILTRYHKHEDMINEIIYSTYGKEIPFTEIFKDPQIIKVIGYHFKYSQAFQNYLSYTYNTLKGENKNLYKNIYTGEDFNPYMQSNGYKSFFGAKLKSNTVNLSVGIGWWKMIYKYIYKKYPYLEYKVTDVRLIPEHRTPLKLTEDAVYSYENIRAFDHQIELIDNLRKNFYAGKIVAPTLRQELATNTGKTIISGLFIKNLENVKVLIPNTRQILTAKTVLDYYAKFNYKVSLVCSKQCRYIVKNYIKDMYSKEGLNEDQRDELLELISENTFGDFCVIMVPFFMSRLDKGEFRSQFLEKYNFAILDEAELLSDSKCINFLNLTKLESRYSCSGTSLKTSMERKLRLFDVLGHVNMKRSNSENVGFAASLPVKVRFIVNKYDVINENYGVKELAEHYIYKSANRINILKKILRKHKGQKIFIYTAGTEVKADFENYLLKQLQEEFPDILLYNSYLKTKDRTQVLSDYISGKCRILIASSIIERGINIKDIEVSVNWAAIGKSENAEARILQSVIGRSIRLSEGQKEVIFYDFWDTIAPFEYYSYRRGKLYENEDNNYKVTYDYKLF